MVAAPRSLEGRIIAVHRPEFLIGRAPECDVQPVVAKVSRRHCVILSREGRAFVEDLGSTHGTFVNGRPIETEAELEDGDRLRVGPFVFEVRIAKKKPPIRPPSAVGAAFDEDAAAALLMSLEEEPAGPDEPTKYPDDSPATQGTTLDFDAEDDSPGQSCVLCGKEGEWLPPGRMLGGRAVSTYRCPGGHTWQVYSD